MWSAKLHSLFSKPGCPQPRADRRPHCRGKRRLAIELLEGRSLLAYNIVDLGGLSASAVNNADQVVGEYSGHAVIQQSGMLIDLGTLGGATSKANDINEVGQIVGHADTPSGTRHAFLLTPEDTDGDALADRWFRDDDLNGVNDLMLDLGTLGGPTSEARGINNLGQVVGRADTSTSTVSYRAFLWDSATGMQDLGTFGAMTSEANAINDGGQVVGSAASFIGSTIYNGVQAFRWDPVSGGSLLASFYGTPRKATAINESGQIVGTSGYVQNFGTLSRYVVWSDAFLWQNGSFTSMGFSNPSPYSQFDVSINTHGQVVSLGYLWEEGTRIDLNTLLDPSFGWVLSTTSDINDAGQVVGRGTHQGVSSSFLVSLGTAVEPPPSISITDVTVTEGDTGAASAVFQVNLSRAFDQTVTVDFSTGGGTATAGSDYAAFVGTVTFTPGQIGQTITIEVSGDTRDEYDETFLVTLASATFAGVADAQATGTIIDNDLPPSLAINDVSIVEGSSGIRYAVFTVTLSAASDKTISVNFATANGTATVSGNDYVAASGTLTFAPGETTKTILVAVKGNTKKEANETFFLNLSGAVNALLGDSQGLGTILNDD